MKVTITNLDDAKIAALKEANIAYAEEVVDGIRATTIEIEQAKLNKDLRTKLGLDAKAALNITPQKTEFLKHYIPKVAMEKYAKDQEKTLIIFSDNEFNKAVIDIIANFETLSLEEKEARLKAIKPDVRLQQLPNLSIVVAGCDHQDFLSTVTFIDGIRKLIKSGVDASQIVVGVEAYSIDLKSSYQSFEIIAANMTMQSFLQKGCNGLKLAIDLIKTNTQIPLGTNKDQLAMRILHCASAMYIKQYCESNKINLTPLESAEIAKSMESEAKKTNDYGAAEAKFEKPRLEYMTKKAFDASNESTKAIFLFVGMSHVPELTTRCEAKFSESRQVKALPVLLFSDQYIQTAYRDPNKDLKEGAEYIREECRKVIEHRIRVNNTQPELAAKIRSNFDKAIVVITQGQGASTKLTVSDNFNALIKEVTEFSKRKPQAELEPEAKASAAASDAKPEVKGPSSSASNPTSQTVGNTSAQTK